MIGDSWCWESKCVPWCRNLSGKVFHVVWRVSGTPRALARCWTWMLFHVGSCERRMTHGRFVCLFNGTNLGRESTPVIHTWCKLMLPNETRIPWYIFKELKLCVLETVFERKRWGELIIHTVECFRFTWRSEGGCDGECGVPIFRLLFPYRWFFFSCMFWSASFRGRDRFGRSRGDAQEC